MRSLFMLAATTHTHNLARSWYARRKRSKKKRRKNERDTLKTETVMVFSSDKKPFWFRISLFPLCKRAIISQLTFLWQFHCLALIIFYFILFSFCYLVKRKKKYEKLMVIRSLQCKTIISYFLFLFASNKYQF